MKTPDLARKIGTALKQFTIQAELAAKTPLAPSADADAASANSAGKPSINNTVKSKTTQTQVDLTKQEAHNLLLVTAAITQKGLLAAELFPTQAGSFNAAATGQPNPFWVLQQKSIGTENIHQAIGHITAAYSAAVDIYKTDTTPVYTTALSDVAKLAQNPARVTRMNLDRSLAASAIDTIANAIITRAFEKQARIEARKHLASLDIAANTATTDTKNDDRKGGQGGLGGDAAPSVSAASDAPKTYPRQKNPAP